MILCAAGLMVAGVLSFAHLTGVIVPCGASSGCASVARDPSSLFLGVPVAYFGFLGYLVLFGLTLGRAVSSNPRPLLAVSFIVSGFGLAASGWLTWYALSALNTVCAWCLASAGIMGSVFILNGLAHFGRHAPSLKPRLAFGLAAVLVAGSIGGIAGVSKYSKPATPTLAFVTNSVADLLAYNAPIRGERTSPVTIVEFADLNCEACAEMHERLNRLIAKRPGRVYLIFRHLPFPNLPGHATSIEAAHLAVTADQQGQFWPFVDQVYSAKKSHTSAELIHIYKGAVRGEDKSAIFKEKSRRQVKADQALAASIGINQTPTYIVFVRGKLIGTATSLDLLQLLSVPEVLSELEAKETPKSQ